MKKVLLATTVLAGFAGAAVAQDATKVKLSGYGRFGIVHNSNAGAGAASSVIVTRMRLNFDASVTVDSGVEFGGRIRMQSTNVDHGATLNDAQLHASYQGLRVEVGNTNTAYDSAALMFDSEMGFTDSSFGDPTEPTFYYNSTPSDNLFLTSPVPPFPVGRAPNGHMGVFVSYSVGDFNGMLSYVNPDQTVSSLPVGTSSETSVAADYKFGQFKVSAAYTHNGAGVTGVNASFIGASYAINDVANVGLNYFDEGASGSKIKTTTLYGNYKMDAITLRGYVANQKVVSTNTAIGIGADYDLGGARLSGSIQRGYANQTVVDLGVRFDF